MSFRLGDRNAEVPYDCCSESDICQPLTGISEDGTAFVQGTPEEPEACKPDVFRLCKSDHRGAKRTYTFRSPCPANSRSI